MANTGSKVVGGGLLAGALVFGGAVARDLGPFADDAARAGSHHVPVPHVPDPPRLPDPPPLPKAPEVPRLPGGVYVTADDQDALLDPLVSTTIKEAIGLVRKMRKGDLDEQAVAKAACKVLDAAAAQEPDHRYFKQMITDQMEQDSGYFVTKIQDRYAQKVANVLTVAHANARAGVWYVQYCLKL